jgi:hypothetical protein
VLSQVANSSNCIVYPLDEEVVSRIPTNINIHDAIIAATGLVFKDFFKRFNGAGCCNSYKRRINKALKPNQNYLVILAEQTCS